MRRHQEHCRHVREQLSDYVNGDLDAQATAAVSRHTRICPNCRRMLTNLSRTVAALRGLRELSPEAGSRTDTTGGAPDGPPRRPAGWSPPAPTND